MWSIAATICTSLGVRGVVHSDDYLYKSWSQGVVHSDDYLYKSWSREGRGCSIATIICTSLGVGRGGGVP